MGVRAVNNNRTYEVHPHKESRGYWQNLAKCQLGNAIFSPIWDDAVKT